MEQLGSDIYAQLKQAQETFRQDSLTLRRDWQSIDKHLDDLVSRRAAAVVELAQLYLPSLSAASVQSAFAEVRQELQQILDRQQRQITELTGRKSRLAEDLQTLTGQIAEQDAHLQQLTEKQESLSAEVTRLLAGQEDFQRISARLLETEGELKRLEHRGKELLEESQKKLPPYKSNRLFQYLLSQQYGTENYSSRGWTRRMDRWVANLIGFAAARRSFEFLTRSPQLFAKEIERRRQEFELQIEQLETIEEGIAERVGLSALLQDKRLVQERKAQLQERSAQINQLVLGVDQQLLTLSREGGPFYQEALGRLRQFLDRTETSVLQSRASQTPTPIDDEIVLRISSLNRDIEVTRPKIERLEADCRDSEERVAGLDFVIRRFSQASFEEPRSRFQGSFELSSLLQQYRTGVLSKDVLWESLRDVQRFEPTPLERQASEIAMHPMTGVLLEAMLRTAGGMAGDQVQRSIRRRTASGPLSGSPDVFHPPAMQLPRWERSSHVPPRPAAAKAPPSARPPGYYSGKGF